MKDTQSVLRQAIIKMAADIYVQPIEQSVLQPVNSRATALLNGWKDLFIDMGKGA